MDVNENESGATDRIELSAMTNEQTGPSARTDEQTGPSARTDEQTGPSRTVTDQIEPPATETNKTDPSVTATEKIEPSEEESLVSQISPSSIAITLLIQLVRAVCICYFVFSFALWYGEDIFSSEVLPAVNKVKVLGLPLGTLMGVVIFTLSSFIVFHTIGGTVGVLGFIHGNARKLIIFSVINWISLLVDIFCLFVFIYIRANVGDIDGQFKFQLLVNVLTNALGYNFMDDWSELRNKLKCEAPVGYYPAQSTMYPLECHELYKKKLESYTETYIVMGTFSIISEVICIVLTEREYRKINRDRLIMEKDPRTFTLWSCRLGMCFDCLKYLNNSWKRKHEHVSGHSVAVLVTGLIVISISNIAFLVGDVLLAYQSRYGWTSLTFNLSSIPYSGDIGISMDEVLRVMALAFLIFTSMNILHCLYGMVCYGFFYRVLIISHIFGSFLYCIVAIVLFGLSYQIVRLDTCCDYYSYSCEFVSKDAVNQVCNSDRYLLKGIAWTCFAFSLYMALLNAGVGGLFINLIVKPVTVDTDVGLNQRRESLLETDDVAELRPTRPIVINTQPSGTIPKTSSVHSELSQLEAILHQY